MGVGVGEGDGVALGVRVGGSVAACPSIVGVDVALGARKGRLGRPPYRMSSAVPPAPPMQANTTNAST